MKSRNENQDGTSLFIASCLCFSIFDPQPLILQASFTSFQIPSSHRKRQLLPPPTFHFNGSGEQLKINWNVLPHLKSWYRLRTLNWPFIAVVEEEKISLRAEVWFLEPPGFRRKEVDSFFVGRGALLPRQLLHARTWYQGTNLLVKKCSNDFSFCL